MIARLGAKAVFLVMALALVFFGVGMLALAIAAAFAPFVGAAWGDAIAGALLLLPPLVWAAAITLSAPPPPPPRREPGILGTLFSAVTRDSPWIAILGAGVAGATEMFLSRNKRRK